MTAADIELIATFFERLSALGWRQPAVENLKSFFGTVAALRGVAHEPLPATASQASLSGISAFLSAVAISPVAGLPAATPFNVWQVAGLGRNEVRTCAVLAWMLDPRGSHGKGPGILNALTARLRQRASRDAVHFPFPLKIDHCYVATEISPFADSTSRVDIVIDGDGFTAFIEVKVGAPPDARQVMRYLSLAQHRAHALARKRYGVVLLAPRWAPPVGDLDDRVIAASWDDVVEAIAATVACAPGDRLIDAALRQFAAHAREF